MPNNELHLRAVILTAISIETQAVCAFLKELHEERHSRGSIYYRGSFSEQGISWDIIVATTGAGNTSAAIETERAINQYNPHLVLFVGVAGGRKDVRIGDVVAGTKVYAYESGRADITFEPRPEVGKPSYRLEQRAQIEANRKDWLRHLKEPLPIPSPRVFLGPIAAGASLITSPDSSTSQLLKQSYGDALAVEMEGHGFTEAVRRTNQHVDSLIIRGISDLMRDKDKSDANNSQYIAAGHASAFALEILVKFALEELERKNQIAQSAQKDGLTEMQKSQEITGQQEASEIKHQPLETQQLNDQELFDLDLLNQYYLKLQEEKLLFSSGRPIFPDQCKSPIKLMEDLDQFFEKSGKSVHHNSYALKKNLRDSRHQISLLRSKLSDLREMPIGSQTSKQYQITLDAIRSFFNELEKHLERFIKKY